MYKQIHVLLLLEELGLVSPQDLVLHLDHFKNEHKIEKFEIGDTTIFLQKKTRNKIQIKGHLCISFLLPNLVKIF